jgi:hypothetical protein
MLPPKVEADIQREVVAWLELHGWDVSITAVRQRPRGVTVGTPDLYVRRGPERIWVEVKRPSEGPSEAQLQWHAAERAAGGTVIVAYSIDDVAALTTSEGNMDDTLPALPAHTDALKWVPVGRGPTREQVAEVQRIILDGADGDMRAEWPLLAAQLYDALVPGDAA